MRTGEIPMRNTLLASLLTPIFILATLAGCGGADEPAATRPESASVAGSCVPYAFPVALCTL